MYAIRSFDAYDFLPNIQLAGSSGSTTFTVGREDAQRTVSVDYLPNNRSIVKLSRAGATTFQAALGDLRNFRRNTPSANSRSFDLAEQFLGLLAAAPFMPFKVYAQIFGRTAVLNIENSVVTAQFEFLPNGTIAANIDADGEEWDCDVEGFTGTSIPDKISAKISMDAGY